MSILVDDSNKTACRAAEAGLQQKNCAALVRPAGTGKGCIVWELLDAHPEMRVLWVVSCAARLELRRALTKRLGRTLGGRVRLMSCEQLAVQNALGWVALAEFRPGLLVLDGWREMSAKDWTDCVQPLFRLCPGAKLLALGEPDAPGDSCRAAEEMLADAIVEPLALGGAMAEGLLPMPASYTALLWPLEDAMARLRAEVKNLHLPGCPDPNAEKYQALSLAVEKLPPVEQLLAQWLPDAAGRCLVLCEDDAAAAQTAEQAEKLFGAGTHIYKDAEGFAADEAATLRLLVCANGPAVQAPLAGISGVVLVRRSAEPTAYRQMLARALAACGSVPVAELSAAFEALTCVQQLRKECGAAGAEAFPLEEPLSACRRAYRQLRRALDSDWERYYAAAKQMTAEGKTLDVPRSYSFGGVAVGRWLENQRLVRAGKKKGRLTAAQAARLDKIGMNWQKRLGRTAVLRPGGTATATATCWCRSIIRIRTALRWASGSSITASAIWAGTCRQTASSASRHWAWCGTPAASSGRRAMPPPSSIIWKITRWKFPSSMSRRTAWRWASGWAVSVPLIKKVC